MRKVLLLIFVVIVFSSCSVEKVFTPPVFEKEQKVSAVVIVDDILIQYAYDMYVDDKYIYLLSLVNDKWIQLFDKQTGEQISSEITLGNGPGEIIMGTNFFFDKTRNIVSIFDSQQMKMSTYDIVMQNGVPSFRMKNDFSFTKFNTAVRNAWCIGDDCYLVDGQIGDNDGKQKRLQLLQDNQLTDSYNNFPFVTEDKRLLFINPWFSLSPSRDKFASGTLYGGILELFEIKNKGIENIATHGFYEPNASVTNGIMPNDQTIYGFGHLYATNNYVYSVLIGDKDANKLDNISVFDWEGNAVVRYLTDKNNFKISVDENNPNIIYALTYDANYGFSLVSYNLK